MGKVFRKSSTFEVFAVERHAIAISGRFYRRFEQFD